MKTIILLISMAVAFVSCETQGTGTRIEKESPHKLPKVIVAEQFKGMMLILDIEHEGNRHEFITTNSYNSGLTHWPSCKYCEDNKQ